MTIEAAGIPVNAAQLSELRSNLGILDFAAGGQSVATSGNTLVFSNSHGISFGLDQDGGSVLTASHNALTTAALSNHSHGNPSLALTNLTGTTASQSNGLTLSLSAAAQSVQTQGSVQVQGSTGAIVFSNSNGITFGGNAGTVTASHNGLTTAAQSNHSHGNPTLALTNLSGTTASASNGLTLSLSAADPSAAIAISADGSSQNAGTVVFSNSNGISFGMSGSTITATVQPGAAAGIAAAQAGTQTATSGTLVFADSNGITFGMSGSSQVTASYTVPGATVFSNSNNVSFGLAGSTVTATATFAQSAQTQSNVQGISAGTQVGRTGDIVFSNSNGVSFGMSGSTRVTASVETSYAASNHSHGDPTLALTNLSGTTASNSAGLTLSLSAAAPAAGVAISAGTQSVSTGTMVFSNSGGVSFGMSGSSRITASVETSYAASNHSHGDPTLALTNLSGTTASASNGLTISLSAAAAVAQTNQTLGLFATGNTTQNSSSTFDARSITFNGLGAATLGFSNGLVQVSVPVQTAQTQSNVQGVIVSDTTYRTGDVSFKNANGITFGSSGANVVTASYTVPNVAAFLTTARASNDAIGLNTAKTNVTWTVNSSGLSFDAGGYAGTGTSKTGAAALTLNTDGLQFNGASLAGTTSGFTGANISASITHNTSGLAMSMSVAAPGAATLSAYAVSNTTQSTSGTFPGSVSFQGVGGVSVGISNGSVIIQGPDLSSLSATGALSASSNGSTISLGVGTVTASIVGNTTQTSTGSVNLNALVLSGAGGASLGISAGTVIVSGASPAAGVAISAGTQSVSTGTMVFSNSNGVTFGMSGSSRITASVETSYAASNHSHGNPTLALTNLTGTTASASNGLTLSLSAAAPSAVAISAAGSSQNAGTVVFSNSNGISFGMNGSTITATVQPGAAAGIAALGASDSTYTSGTVILSAGAGAITIGSDAGQKVTFAVPATSSLVGASGISVSTNGSTVSIVPTVASYFAWPMAVMANTQTQAVQSNTSVVAPIEVHDLEAFGFLLMPATVSIASMASIATAANNTKSYTQAATFNLVLYSRGVGASSQSLQSVASTSLSSQMTVAIGQNAQGSQWTVTHAFSFPASNTAQATLSTSYATTLSNVNVSTTHLTAISGIKKQGFPWATTLTDGQYWLAFGMQTAQTTNGNASLSNMRVTASQLGLSQVNVTFGEFGSANAASIQAQFGVGSYSNGAAVTTASIALSAISSSASHLVPFLTFGRIA